MVYVGHFTFRKDPEDRSTQEQPYHGCFTTIVDAESIGDAIDKLGKLILRLRKDTNVLDGINEVFLDSCVECLTIPEGGFLAHFIEWESVETGSISTSIRGATNDQAVAYSIRHDGQNDNEDGHEIEPFVAFDD